MGSPVLSITMPFEGQSDITFALSLATAIAIRQLVRFPQIPSLYGSGVRWARDVCRAPNVPGACERFLSPLDVLKEGRIGDCDDLAPWRAAEIILGRGTPRDRAARAVAIPAPGVGYHALVKLGNGMMEDPSKRLGMR